MAWQQTDDKQLREPMMAKLDAERTRDIRITSLLCQNEVATSFWRNNDAIIPSRIY